MKKKILTLLFTMLLIVSVVVAISLTAGAASAPDCDRARVYAESYSDLENYFPQLYDGTVLILTEDITAYDNEGTEDLTLPAISAGGDVVIDLNGHDILFNSTNTSYIFKLSGYEHTNLHIVNSKHATDPAYITLNSKRGGSAVVGLFQENSSLHVYEGVTLRSGWSSGYFKADGLASVIYVDKCKEVALHGADLYQGSAFGSAISYVNGSTNGFVNSKLTIEGDSQITAKSSGIYFYYPVSYPKMEIKTGKIYYNNIVSSSSSDYAEKSDFRAIHMSSSTITFGDIVPAGHTIHRGAVGYSVDKTTAVSSINNGDQLRFGYQYGCEHSSGNRRLLVTHLGTDNKRLHHYICGSCSNKVTTGYCEFDKMYPRDEYIATKASYTEPATYYYLCRFCDVVSDKTFTYGDKLSLGTPSGLTDTQTTNAITLKWNAVEGATGYRVFVRNTTTNKWDIAIKTTGKKTTATLTGLKPGTRYTYAVRAYVNVGTIVWAPKFATIYSGTQPPVITTLKAAPSATSVKLTWGKVAATGYRVFQYNTSTKKWDIIVKSTKGTTATITGLTAGKSYIFCVRPYLNTSTKIVWAKTYTKVSTATVADGLATPGIKGWSSAAGRATVGWDKVSGALGYQLYYSTNKTSGYKKISNYSGTSTYHYGLESGKTYYYRVRAYAREGSGYTYSSFSPVLTVVAK